MSTDTEKLLLAVVSQLEINKLDYDRLARDIGILSSEAARLRWFRLKSKLKQSAATTPNTGPSKPSGVQKTKSTPRTRKMGAHIKSESGRDELVNPVTPPLKRLPSKRARAKQIIEISDSDIDEGLMEDMQKAEKKERCDGGWEELPMVASADDQKVLLGVLTQAKVGKIDYDQLSRYLETTKGAAQVRWSRFNSKLRNPGNSMTADDNKLALGVISQADMGKINYEQLGNFLGTTKGAAQVRWSRFKSKLRQSSGTSLTQPAGVKKTKSPAKASVQAKRKRKEEAITIPAIPPGNLSSRKVRGQALKQESDKGESEGEDV